MTDPIWQSFRNVTRITEEAEALIGTYDRAIRSHDFGRFEIDVDDWWSENLEDENDWCTLYYVVNYKIYERLPRRASRGMAALGLSLYRFEDEMGEAWSGAKRAKLYAGFAPTAQAWGADTMFVNGSGGSGAGERLSDELWGSRDAKGNVTRWFFAVALDAIGSRTDFNREVLTPLTRLLNGHAGNAAFAESTALLRSTDPAGAPVTPAAAPQMQQRYRKK